MGNRELGFCSGEGAWEIATTSKEGSRRVNYPILINRGSDKKSESYAVWLNNCIEIKNKNFIYKPVEGKSGASSRGNSSSNSLC